MKTAFITGVGGQDGYFLSCFLLHKGYRVYGLTRSPGAAFTGKLSALLKNELKNITLLGGDVASIHPLSDYIKKYKFDEVYHLAGQTSIHPSLKNPNLAYRDNIDSVIHLLEAIKNYSPKTKLFLAASSELFGDTPLAVPQNEKTPFFPRNPYGFSKLAAFWMVKYYRENYNIFACSGILYNHESGMRGEEFVTRKISMGVAKILAGAQKKIVLGDVGTKRDWGYAGDYVEAMWKMLQQKKPDDYVVATGKVHSVQDFINEAFACVGTRLVWRKKGRRLVAMDIKTKRILVESTASEKVKTKTLLLFGDASKAKKNLAWAPRVHFKALVRIMVSNDVNQYNGR